MKKIFAYIMNRLMAVAGLLFVASAAPSSAQDGSENGNANTNTPWVVVELFTSQGCSSCPPADRLLQEIRGREDTLALSWPVDYWDRLGWEDTFAHPDNARRQAAYNKRLGLGGVFTPQMVFNGNKACVGSRRDDVNAAMTAVRAAETPWITPNFTLEENGIRLELPATTRGNSEALTVRIVWYTQDATVQINDGENRGRALHYANVVRHSSIEGEWTGQGETRILDLQAGLDAGADHVAVLLQTGYQHGAIVGAAMMALTDMPTRLNVGR